MKGSELLVNQKCCDQSKKSGFCSLMVKEFLWCPFQNVILEVETKVKSTKPENVLVSK